MRSLFRKIPPPLRFVILVYLCGMAVFSLFRITLLLMHTAEAGLAGTGVLSKAFIMGFRFDAVINGYLVAIPLILFFIFSFSEKFESLPKKVLVIYIIMVYAVSFFIHCADLPWFNHNQSRLTVAALTWTDTPGMMLKITFQDVYNYPYLILFILLVIFFRWLVLKLKAAAWRNRGESSRATVVSFYLLVMLLVFIGIRGRLAIKSPIRWGTAFFSPNNFANQLGLNPVFTFMRSWLDKKEQVKTVFHFMDDAVAEETVRKILGPGNYDHAVSPVARKINTSGSPHPYNVVVVLMEGMSAKNMKYFGQSNNLTPVLDSLFGRSLSFTDFYSDGVHTHNGIYSSLYGFHCLPMSHHMKDLEHQQPYTGLPGLLSSIGYQTLFFTTHDDQFDNMAGFLLPNGFQRIISEKDFPGSQALSTLGVPDHILFDRSIAEMNTMAAGHEPFFVAMITGSNHGPYVLPENIPLKTRSPSLKEKLVEYADWSIGKFLTDAAYQPWFDSTIFIFTGDHGALTAGFDRYLAFHHVPLIIYAPEIFPDHRLIESAGGQADIYATVAGLLNVSYTNNSMGIDLLRQERKYYPFNNDEEMCCVSSENLLTLQHGRLTYYSISDNMKLLVLANQSTLSDSMLTFTHALLQVTQKMLKERKMVPPAGKLP